jgi:hypothetical protein
MPFMTRAAASGVSTATSRRERPPAPCGEACRRSGIGREPYRRQAISAPRQGRWPDSVAESKGRIAMTGQITVDRLVVWGQQICRVESTDPGKLARELGWPGTLVPGNHRLELEPPLPGTSRVALASHDDAFDYLEIEFEDASLTRAGIEAWFGNGRELPRVHWDSNYKLVYTIGELNAPYGCDLSAEFAVQPAGDTPVIGVMMRRTRAWG